MTVEAVTRYQVFGRKAYHQPLTLQGPLEVEDGEDVQAAGLAKYGPDWIELVAAREDDVLDVTLKR